MTAELPAGGKLKLDGTAGPINATDNTQTPLTADLTLTHLEPVGAGFLAASGGVDGVLDVAAQLKSDGKVATLTGKVTGNKMKFAAKGTPTSETVTVDFATAYTLASEQGQITQGNIHAGNVAATVGGSYLLAPAGTEVHLAVNAPGMSVDALQTLLPAFGVSLPSGSGLKGGSLSASLKIDGPVGKLVIAGPIDLRNTTLAGFSLASKLGSVPGINKLGGGGSGTEIQSLHADIVMTPAQLATKNINAVVPALGSATGDGVIYPDNTLDYKMNAKLNGLGQLVGSISNLLGGKKSSNAGGIPLIIKGTTQSPSFSLDTSAMGLGKPSAGNSSGSSLPTGKLKGLFGK
jgi:AsmA protein